MKIIIDAMGGDRAPEEIVKAVAESSGTVDADLVVTGDENEIKKYLSQFGADLSRIEIVPTETVITMEDDPLSAVKTKKDSSMSEGLRLLRDGGDALVSAGNTGALFVGALPGQLPGPVLEVRLADVLRLHHAPAHAGEVLQFAVVAVQLHLIANRVGQRHADADHRDGDQQRHDYLL